MSAGSSIGLSEFFDDDDSEGFRFVDFIKNRQGCARKQNVLFMDCETDRLSLEVQLEKLPTPQCKRAEIIPSQNKENCSATANCEIGVEVNEKASDQILSVESSAANKFEFTKPQYLPPRTSSAIHSDVRKSGGGNSPSVRLRRLCFKNNSAKKLLCGRRILLREFESTVDGASFDPTICSTPISQHLQNAPQLSMNTNQLPEIENIDGNNKIFSNTSESCRRQSDSSNKTFQGKDAEPKDYMENNLDKTLQNIEDQSKLVQNSSPHNTIQNIVEQSKLVQNNSQDNTIKNIGDQSKLGQNSSSHNTIDDRTKDCTSSKLTFTVERGSVPGQLVLTPDKSKDQSTRLSNLQQSLNQKNHTRNLSISKHSRRNYKTAAQKSALQISPGCSLSQRVISKIQQSNNLNKQAQKEVELQKVSNSFRNNQSIILRTQNVERPVIQNERNVNDSNLLIYSDKGQHVVVIPFNQTLSEVTSQEKNNDNINSKTTKINICHSSVQAFKQAEDNLKLADILTDDEETTPEPMLQNASQIPLNLAASSYNLQKTGVQKCFSKLQKDNLQLTSNTEVETPPPAHTNRLIRRRKYKPLNKAPGVPLNGEEYAEELARMSNYEILDLRKRNSMGEIFVISDRWTRQSLKELNKKKQQLDHQIEEELSKRNLNNIVEHQTFQTDQGNFEDETLPGLYNCEDIESAKEQGENVVRDSSLIDEKTPDRIKFLSNKKKNRVDSKKILPEVLKQYLDVSKRYSVGKQRKCKTGMSKRSLFNTQSLGQYDKADSLTEKSCHAESMSSSRLKKLSIHYLKSPPKLKNDLVATPKVVSPPPAFGMTSETRNNPSNTHADLVAVNTTTSEIQNTRNKTYVDMDENFTLPPPPGFESDSSMHLNNNTNQCTTNITLEIRNINESIKTNNDDHLFKKPVNPVPKRKAKKTYISLDNPEESAKGNQKSIDSSADFTEGGSLRRSKRGQVSRCNVPILDILYQQEIKRMERYKQIKETRIRKQREEFRKLKKNKTSKSVGSKILERTENSLPTVSEDDNVLSHCRSQNTEKVETKSTKIKSKQTLTVTRSQKQLLSPLPLEHLNNMFDQLKQNSLTSNATNEHHMSEESNNNQEQASTEPLKDMRISSATNMCFTELQGLEYAFYDTKEKASLGYLRFKPQQIKPKRKAKRFDLQFINLMGLFRTTINNSEIILNVGDLVTIQKANYYGIQNLSDDTGILMVIKK